MFYLSGRGVSGKSETEDEFGWYLGDHEQIEDRIYNDSGRTSRSLEVNGLKSQQGRETSSPSSTYSCAYSCDDSGDYAPAKEFTTRVENGDDDSGMMEHIEMKTLKRPDELELDLAMIERDADRVFNSSTISAEGRGDSSFKVIVESEDETSRTTACYTPERLVRCQEYRILTHSPKFFAIPRSTPNGIDDTSVRRYRGHRRRLGDLIDSKQFGGSHLEVLLDPTAPEMRLPVTNRRRLNFRDRASSKKNVEQQDVITESRDATVNNRESPVAFRSLDLASSRSSYDRLNTSWEECSKIVRPASQDTSGIHSNDWSTDTPSDIQTPLCLCDELATASRSFSNATESRNRTTAINEVVSILEDLERDPDRAAALLEEDRFCVSTTGHDNLTRLALSIEPDGAVPPTAADTHSLLVELRDKVERLQETSKDIFKDIHNLRADFEYNENKVDDLIDETATLRQNVNEMRYLDDLLSLLDGELERISRRNWPFVFGQSESRAEDMNLVV